MKLDLSFEQNQQNINVPFSESGGEFSANFGETSVIHDGQNGATFIPSVSTDGVISWTNDRDLPNPGPVNIKGKKGDKGERGERGLQGIQGIQGERGADGAKGDKGDKGDRGEQGIQGIQGEKGEKGDKGEAGKNGENGKDGYTPVKGVDYFDGANGKDGKDGEDGYTPVKGKDYFTDADKEEMVNSVISALPKYNGEVTAVE